MYSCDFVILSRTKSGCWQVFVYAGYLSSLEPTVLRSLFMKYCTDAISMSMTRKGHFQMSSKFNELGAVMQILAPSPSADVCFGLN